jgi:UDP-N-acetylglucosamine--N-acetylmuramyl-(pentapeptide) pyrophosphoryl-undecaprenol N-acetylglucosamine transferase
MKVIIAAAGTAGHINPGIAIANKIKKESPSSEIIFLGTERGLENDLVPRAGYTLKTIEAYGLSKIIGIQSLKNNLKTLKGIKEAKKIVKEFKPDIIIGTGGYICGAAILAGKRYKVPTMLHESNAFPGKAVKMLSKKVDTILISFEEARKELPNAKNIVLTGTPTKIKNLELNQMQKSEVIRQLGLKQGKPVVLVFGGSQGAKAINDAITSIINKNLNKDYQIMWAPGPLQFDIVKRRIKNLSKQDQLKIVPYIYNMEEIMNSVDLVIARSGAMTITELSIVRKTSNIYSIT